jgi:hypothetical protein
LEKESFVITYEDLVKPMREGGQAFDPDYVAKLKELAWDTDRLFLYRNQMLDSSRGGRAYLLLAGPGRTMDAKAPKKRIDPDGTQVPSGFAELVGEVDIKSVFQHFLDAESK